MGSWHDHVGAFHGIYTKKLDRILTVRYGLSMSTGVSYLSRLVPEKRYKYSV